MDIAVLNNTELKELISTDKYDNALSQAADNIRRKYYSNHIYIRGLIEFTNYCKNNCYYCGLRGENYHISRYRLTKEQILSCCTEGYNLGFRTFVLQGGEDLFYTDKSICEIISSIKESFPQCAVTLSIGEKSKDSYKAYFKAGADRYLLRHETAEDSHYNMLHPASMSLSGRKKCLYDLKDIGYQVGSGFMVGSPYQTINNLIADIRFLQDLKPDMIGIGPYITHSQTPFKDFPSGSFQLTLRMISILRLLFNNALIPATTALGTIHPSGREAGIKAGANVIMPNLSPPENRKNYSIYDNKLATGLESAQYIKDLSDAFDRIGYKIVIDRGDVKECKND